MNRLSGFRKQLKYWLFNDFYPLRGSFYYYGIKTYFPRGSELFRRVCSEGIYEIENVALILKLMPPNGLLFDVGANIGLMAIPILQSYPDCQAISFEPSPNTLIYLRRTICESNLKERWKLREVVLSDHSGETDLFVHDVAWGAFDSTLQNNRISGEIRKFKVPVKSLDEEWQKLGCPVVSVIKIDVEGAEIAVLNGAKNCILNNRPYILVEWTLLNLKSSKQDPCDLLTLADKLDYTIVTVPRLLYVPNFTTLELYMKETESFLLIPNNNGNCQI